MIAADGFWTKVTFYCTAGAGAWDLAIENYSGFAFQAVMALFVIVTGTRMVQEQKSKEEKDE